MTSQGSTTAILSASVAHPRNLSVLSYAAGFTLWYYKANTEVLLGSADPHSTTFRSGPFIVQQPQLRQDLLTPGFFNSLADLLAPGDMILCSCLDGGLQLYISEIFREATPDGTYFASVSVQPMLSSGA